MEELEAVAFRRRAVDMSDWKATRLTQGFRTLLEHFDKSVEVAQSLPERFSNIAATEMAKSRKTSNGASAS
jgi:predicted RNA-binding protein with PUA domain